MKNNTLIAGVIFPGVEKYLNDYLDSLNNQTDKKFDLLIVNDFAKIEIKNKFSKAIWIDVNLKLTPASIRQLIYDYAVENKYNFLVFSDVDDYFSNNRIKITKKQLQKYDFVCNELTIVDDNKKNLKENFLSDFFSKKNVNTIDFLLNKNLVGLGNSAIKLNQKIKIEIPENIIAVDWFIYTILLLNNCKGIFTDETITFYRQYNENLVGISKKINEKSLQQGLIVKSLHYDGITEYCNKNNLPEENLFNKKYIEIKELKTALKVDNYRKKYIDIINTNFDKIFCGWWSEILTLEQIKQYET
ncbi:MAG: hypothetical protein HY958_11720 [Bacteroidia bacterium]|nr:hypothetical protein [Bacteroidia bacterium]